MVKYLCFAFVIVFYGTTVKTTQAACTSLEIGYAENWFPVAYDQAKRKTIGIAIDIQREVFRRLNVTTRYIANVPWKRQLNMLEKGELDAIATIFYNAERGKKFVYTNSFMENRIHVFKNRNSAIEYRTLEDLIGSIGVAPLGADFGYEFNRFEKEHLTLTRMSGTKKLVEVTQSGRADYFVIPKDLADHIIAEHHAEDDIVITGPPIAVQPIHMAFSKVGDCTDLIPKINRIISDMKNRGDLEMIRNQFMQSVMTN